MPLTPQPAAPGGSPYTITNPFGQWCSVAITGGTVSAVTVNGVSVASSSPANIAVPPAGVLVVTYSVLPTLTWANFPAVGYGPGYGGENTALTNLEGNLPWGAHAEGGETGLGIAVSN